MKKLYIIIAILTIIATIYLFANIEVLLWYIIDPIGFWAYFWFYILSGTIFSVTISILQFLIISLATINFKEFKAGPFLLIAFIGLLEIGVTLVIPTVFTKTMYNRYRYVEQTEKYLLQGRYEKALKYSTDVFLHSESSKKSTPRFWFLKRYYLRTDKGHVLFINREYQSTINYAECLASLGNNLDKAQELYIECEKLYRKNFPDEIEYYLMPLTGLINIYIAKGEIIQVERLYNEVSPHLINLKEKDVFLLTNMLVVYSTYMERHGDIERAYRLRKDALEKYTMAFPDSKSRNLVLLLLLVAKDDLQNNLLFEARVSLDLSKELVSKRRKELVYLIYLDLEAQFQELSGYILEAEKLYLKAKSASKNKSASEYSSRLVALGSFYFRQKDYNKSYENFYNSLKVLGNQQTSVSYTQYSGTILSSYAIGNKEVAGSQMQKIDSLVKDQINQHFVMLTPGEKESFVLKTERSFKLSNSLYISLKDTSLNGNIYNNILAIKSIALLSYQFLDKMISSYRGDSIRDQYKSIIDRKQQIERESFYTNVQSQKNIQKLDSLNFAERTFIENLSINKEFHPFNINDVKWQDVLKTLKKNEAAIEFAYYPLDPCLPGNNRYYALLIKPSYDYPKLVPLFEESSIQNLFKKVGSSKEIVDSLYSGKSFNLLYEKIWAPLKPFLKDTKKVYISVSGVLHQISFPALTINEKEEVILLSSTRVLVNERNSIEKIKNKAVLYGGIQYNANSDTSTNHYPLNFAGNKINLTLYRNIDNSSFSYLPASKNEIYSILEILKKHNVETNLYSEGVATEGSFRNAIEKGPSIIHLATHGFYYPKETSSVLREKIWGLVSNYEEIDNPMDRSGILFAGIKQDSLITLEDDGILTSREIAELELTNIKLIVLSACETGLGDINGSEGVFGLQRAFKLAGAKSLIMSLWKIPDRETSVSIRRTTGLLQSDPWLSWTV